MSHVDAHQPGSPLQSGLGRPDTDVQTIERTDHQRVRLLAEDPLELSKQGGKSAPPSIGNASPITAKPTKPPSVFGWWFLEILCCLLSLGSLAAQVGVLARYNSKPQDSWPSQTLTLNALIATLSTICRTSLMCTVGSLLAQAKWNRFSSRRETDYFPLKDYALLDEASRGSWGSARLLYRFKGSHVACLGAALSILSQAFGLFSQQLVTLRTDQVELRSATATGQVARTVWLKYDEDYLQATKIAMYTGFMAPSIGIPQVQCPTGICTWPIIPTIGVCGACLNVTDHLSFSRVNKTACVLEIPNGTKLERDFCYPPYTFISDTYFTTGPGSGRVFNSSSDIPRREAFNVIAEFGGIGVPESKMTTQPGVMVNDSIAVECALWYCLQAREIRVEKGELRDRITETWGEVPIHYESYLSGNVTFANIPSSMGTAAGDQYTVSWVVLDGVRELARTTFQGSLVASGAGKTEFALSLSNAFDDIHDWMDRLASSLTNAVRINGTDSPTDERYWGTAITGQVVIVVRWEWIVYPAVMVGASMVYLVLEIVRTARIGVRPWKDDPLLPVCMEVDEEVRLQAGKGLDEPDGIEKRVGEYESFNMWLINTETLKLESVVNPETVEYAILSHTWEEEEVSFQEFQDLRSARTKKGFGKIKKTCRLAKKHGYQYAWVDTCCIDKSSSAELSEAINSMFSWYKGAKRCYAYLSDYRQTTIDSDFANCRNKGF
ncbi:hypothetical protein CEP51_011630 [Fusarium floridanum]|uniref:Heterokaryon incompatibility domain-containing protein n=1 Tax=Fusarium floridanum TaxID=1325733 RepID=A0A428R9J7_9HYPO|nr:hypothetical protein CEP51_011630 [Fusarium floridanum]